MYQGGRDPVTVPAGKYKIDYYRIHGPEGALLIHQGRIGKALQAKAGETTEWKLGGPVTVQVVPRVSNGRVVFSCKAEDAEGLSITSVVGRGGKRTSAPQLKVMDAGGKIVHKGTMEYG
jgi:hypothetical protein